MSIFRVEITETAFADVSRQYRWLAQRSVAGAERWRRAIIAAADSLTRNPERCPLAPESELVESGDIRQLLHGKRRNVYRILFRVRDDVVYVLRVRHSAQDLLDPEDLEQS